MPPPSNLIQDDDFKSFWIKYYNAGSAPKYSDTVGETNILILIDVDHTDGLT